MCSSASEGILERLVGADPAGLTGAELSAWLAQWDRVRSQLEAKALEVAAAWDARAEWAQDGCRSGKAWLVQRCDMRAATAFGLVRDARKLRDLPTSAAATGPLGSTKVRTMLGFVNERTVEEYQRCEQFLLDQAVPLTVDETAVMMRFWAMHADPSGADPADRSRNELHLHTTFEGLFDLRGTLDAVSGAELATELDRRADMLFRAHARSGDGIERSRAQFMAEALGTLLRDASLGGRSGRVPAKPSVTAIVDVDILTDLLRDRQAPSSGRDDPFGRRAERSDAQAGDDAGPPNCHIGGTDPIRGETARRLACDAGINRLITKGRSVVLDAGRTVRTVTPAQRKAMRDRSPTCEFGGCDLPERYCDAHHIEWWGRDDGKTDIHDLAFVCAWHHWLVHEAGWIIARLNNGEIEIRRPDGTLVTSTRAAA